MIIEKDHQIAELRDDRSFLREEIRESRKQRDQVKEIANRMLETMERIANGRALNLGAAVGESTSPKVVIYRPVQEDPNSSPTA